ncbi:MAG: phospholipase D-like domain-containing protein, partial [Thermoanaerobaculia bacterium]|nr:phospholipase D-like domain-containing protein [Thermoanaerobaculia bacterium]
AQAGYVGHRRDLVASGIELWEYAGPEALHAKAAVIDRRTVVVGSYNLDPRSERLNSELALVADDRVLAARLLAVFDRHLDSAWRIDARGWPQGADGPFPGVSRAKICQLRLMRLTVPFVKGQL